MWSPRLALLAPLCASTAHKTQKKEPTVPCETACSRARSRHAVPHEACKALFACFLTGH